MDIIMNNIIDLFQYIYLLPILMLFFFFAYTWISKADGVDFYLAAHINLLQTEKLDRDGEIPATGTIQWDKGSDIASAGTLVPGSDGNCFDVTGITAITAINASQSQPGTVICLHFDAILTLTHHASNLILPGGANITTAAGDEAIFYEYDTNKWRCLCYTRADGTPIATGVHGSSHHSGGSDAIKIDDFAAPDDNADLNVSITAHGLCPKAPNVAAQVLKGDASWGLLIATDLPAHASRHQSGGADAIKLDDFAAPDDNTDLNVSITAHGLCPKAPNVASQVLKGNAAWAALIATDLPAHASRHKSGGADPIKIDDLASPDDNTDLNVSITKHGLCPKLNNVATDFLNGQGGWTAPVESVTVAWKTIDCPAGTDPVADAAEDTLQLLAGSTKITITGNEGADSITFDVAEGQINHNALLNYVAAHHYDWTNETHNLHTTGSGRFDTVIWVNESSNANMNIGICVNMGGYDNEIQAGKSDIAHGMTDYAETDHFYAFRKAHADDGGLAIRAFSKTIIGFAAAAFVTTADTAKNATATGAISLVAHKKSGTGVGDFGANENILVVTEFDENLLILNREGALYLNATCNPEEWDDYSDWKVAKALRASLMPDDSDLRRRYADIIEKYRPILSKSGIVVYNPDGIHYLNMKDLALFSLDGLHQVGHEVFVNHEKRLAEIENKLRRLAA